MEGNMKLVGICLGASTITLVELVKGKKDKFSVTKSIKKAHEGNPKGVLTELIKDFSSKDAKILVTGRKFRNFVTLPGVTEPEAIEVALDYVNRENKKYDILISMGGETFIVYILDNNNKISDVLTGNKCASGTGEFFMQQIRRMNLSLEEAIELGEKGTAYAVSGRCSVFCKSDCTHALNKGIPTENVTAGLCEMMSEKIVELISNVPHENILAVGGVTLNTAIISKLREKLSSNIEVKEESSYFEALGAALLAEDRGEKLSTNLFKEEEGSFSFLEPISDYKDLVKFNTIEFVTPSEGDKCILGLDVGSTTTKAVLLRKSDDKMICSEYLRTNGNPIEASRNCYKSIREKLNGVSVNIVAVGVTGSGRQIAGLYTGTEGVINEIIAHAAGAVHFDKDVDTIFEIGGQDAKYTYLTNSVASDYAMNEACSAGTGSFIEESALESLGVDVYSIAEMALKADKPANFSDQCAAFISSDIKNAAHEKVSQENILAGLVYSICLNYVNRVKGNRPVGKKIFMQGGVCYNKAIPLAMAAIMKKPIIVPPEPGLMGAFGVALEVKKRLHLGLMHEEEYSLDKIIEREIAYKDPFVCPGGKEKCDRKCKVNRIEIDKKVYPFGGACNKYYNTKYEVEHDIEALSFLKVREDLMFEKYAPAIPQDENKLTIGINKSFLTYSLFPLYYNFFTRLGCNIVLPDEIDDKGTKKVNTAICFPARLSLGYFANLVSRKPDYYFMPHITEMYVQGGNKRKEFSSVCLFEQGEAFLIKQAFKDVKDKILAPSINFINGWHEGEDGFVEVAVKIGFDKSKAKKVYKEALEVFKEYEKEYKSLGKKALDYLEENPGKIGIVIVGRPYNAFAFEANKGIEKKLTSRGYLTIPYDMLPYQDEELDEEYKDYMHWESGHKILRGAKYIKKNPRLFALYVTNFLCAIDSFLVTYFRSIMGTKPSLTLEFDTHTADAGIDTRIEAFVDVIKNYMETQKDITEDEVTDFRQATIDLTSKGATYIDSEGKKFSLKDKKVKLIFPGMGKIQSRILGAVFKKLGINAEELPIADKEVFQLGRSVSTCKECLPMLVCIGSLLKYLKTRGETDEKLVMFLPKANGYCRLGQYHVFTNKLIKDKKLKDIALISLASEDGYAGLGPVFALKAWESVIMSDALDEIYNLICAAAQDKEQAKQLFEEELKKIENAMQGLGGKSVNTVLKETAKRLATIKLSKPYEDIPKINLTGEFFVRWDSGSNLNIVEKLTEKGFAVKISPVAEWLYYVNYMIKTKLQEPSHTMLGKLEFAVSDMSQKMIESRIKSTLAKSGLYKSEMIDIAEIIEHSTHILPTELKGEPALIIGSVLKDALSEYAGVINIGPFGCMPLRYTEALLVPENNVECKIGAVKRVNKKANTDVQFVNFDKNDKIPFLTIESDGNPYPQLLEARLEAFLLQASRTHKKMHKK
ncbi:MAG TPA: activase [Clostridiales bacterium]|nr:activase [Clostridiales bacterium]